MALNAYRSGLTIYAEQAQAIQELLTNLAESLPASLVLLTDSLGDIIFSFGSADRNLLVPLASLVASDLVASQEIAHLTEGEGVSPFVLREGQNFNSFILDCGTVFILFVQTEREVPIGLMRLILKDASAKLQKIAHNPPAQPAELPNSLGNLQVAGDLDRAFDSIFG